jgi:uncharacterized protein YndB with AHSA1/START domain
MLPKAEAAFFVIADIAGYTSFLSGVELDHAQDIIADIMNTVVRALRPPFRLAKFEGDAAFLYAVTDKIDGSVLQDRVERAYFAFRKRLRTIRQATSCECQACRQMQSLDVKFVAHHGAFVRQKMAGREELAGREIILVHRLLKNEVGTRLGGHAYALYSDACVQAMAADPVAEGLVEHRESVDIIGDVTCWLRDLEVAWQREVEAKPLQVQRADSFTIWEYDVDAARPVVWEHCTLPGLRAQWQPTDAVIEQTAQGRRGVGTQNHCMHGKDVIIEEILDWRPPEYMTFTTQLPVPGAPKILMSYCFSERQEGGTHAELRIAKPKPKDQPFLEQVAAQVRPGYEASFVALRALLAGQADAPEPLSEPPVPASAERFMTQPVKAR